MSKAPTFNLTRYFSTLSFILIVLAGGLLGAYFEEIKLRLIVVAVLTLLFLFQLFVVGLRRAFSTSKARRSKRRIANSTSVCSCARRNCRPKWSSGATPRSASTTWPTTTR